ncbi:MAG TPA: CRISPR-associated endoribonuclease Cas6 [Thermosipho africanus]|nr:CRISPR-associated endoribonuclease Cas6 [Thermosipho africanus]
MRIVVYFDFKKLELPIDYNHILQAVILNLIDDEEYRKFIHDEGFSFFKRKFKLYTFSRLMGEFSLDSKSRTISFKDNAFLIISSYDDNFCYYLMKKLLEFKDIKIGRNIVNVKKVEIVDFKPDGEQLKVVTRSPVTAYSTVIDENSSKKTIFYHPDDFKFKELLEKNIEKKFIAIYGKEPEGKINITHVGKLPKKVVLKYKKFKIVGWMSAFDLSGDPELLKIAYDTGLGSKNSQGFGLIERVG